MAIPPQRLTIYLYNAHRAVIFAIAQLSCYIFASVHHYTNSLCVISPTTSTQTDRKTEQDKNVTLSYSDDNEMP